MGYSIRPYLVLIRPANVVTSMADALAGTAVAGLAFGADGFTIAQLVVVSAFLYAGGIVFNDIFDRRIDQEERPERPIPSGQVPVQNAVIFGLTLLLVAVGLAFQVGELTGFFSLGIVFFALSYDRFAKHHPFFGPLFMGTARALNLLMGISVVTSSLTSYYWLGILPLLFIASVTLASREENRGENRSALWGAVALDVVVAGLLAWLIIQSGTNNWYFAALGGVAWLGIVLKTKLAAIKVNTPDNIRKAVKTGVLSLILLDATYALAFEQYSFAALILILLPLSLVLARKFAVT